MIPITKRARSIIMLNELNKTGLKEKIIDVGGADSYFAKQAKNKGYDVESIDILNGQDFLLLESTNAKIVTALALLWHIDNKAFMEKCRELGIQHVFILQGKDWTEPIAHLYSPDHHHEINFEVSIELLAKNNGFETKKYASYLLWDFYHFTRI